MNEQKEIVSTSEVADMLNVRPNRVAVWLHRKKMPQPFMTVNNGTTPLWYKEDVLQWAKFTGKMPITRINI